MENKGPINFAKVFKENKRFEELNNEDYDDGVYLRPMQTGESSHQRHDMATLNKNVNSDDLDPSNISDTMPFEFRHEIEQKEQYIAKLKYFGYKPDYIKKCFKKNLMDYCNAAYHLL